MKKGIIGKKIGMTQIFDEVGNVVPVTIIEAGPCVVAQKKTVEHDGYSSVQLGFEDAREKSLNKAEKGHFAKAGVAMKKHLKEFRLDDISNVKVINSGTKTPRASINDPNDNDRISDRYVEDGSYLRIKNLTLGYTFPKKWMEKARIDNIRLYCNIQNLYTFTKYSGYDPEVGASTQDSTGLTFGLDNGRYPSPTTYSFGLNITF